MNGRSRGITAMADPSDRASQACLLVYDGQCRPASPPRRALSDWGLTRRPPRYGWFRIRAKRPSRLWGRAIRSGRPNAAFLVRPNGEIARGLDAFLALLPGLKGGRVLSVLLRLPLVKPFGYLLYWFVARYRYSIFGKVPLAGASEDPSTRSRETPHK